MIRFWAFLFAFLSAPVWAAPVVVTSGEHDGFTRLVFDYGVPVDWQLGRSADGYELRHKSGDVPYDLRQAFDLIGKSRLAAIWVDPATGALHIGLACACHAIPFEFRPGIVVIDLKDGAPPKGSAFELALDGSETVPIAAAEVTRPRPRPEQGYRWTDLVRNDPGDETTPAADEPVKSAPEILPPDPGLQPLRDQLLHQMARGAAQGVVEMAKPDAKQLLPESDFPSAQIRIGDHPANVRKPDTSVQSGLSATGDACIAADKLEISGWGDETRGVFDQMAEANANLTGEFDRPDTEAVARAIRFQLYLGFGVEAQQLIRAFSPDDSAVDVWESLGQILDERVASTNVFIGLSACDGPSALWAVLADDSVQKGDAVNTAAVRLAFSALPIHLRRHLGPRLADRFLAMEDTDSARAFRDAILRAPGEAGHEVALLDAEIDLKHGNPAEAEHKITGVLADPGPDSPEALIALTQARVAQGLPIDPPTAAALQSLLAEHAGTELAPALHEAHILASAASGDFSTAFSGLEDLPQASAAVWSLTATLAPDDTFLTHAVLAVDAALPALPTETRLAISRRLLGLGLADPAERWLADLPNVEPLLQAQIALGQRDGRKALVALAGLEGAETQALTLMALEIIGQDGLRAEILAKADQPDAENLALARAENWPALAETGVEPWKSVAVRLGATPETSENLPPSGELTRGHLLVQAGADTRSAIADLLASLPAPQSP